MPLDRAAFLAAANRRRYDTVSLNGQQVRMQSLSTLEMRQLRSSLQRKDGELNRERADRLRELLIVRCLVDDDGHHLFAEHDALNGTFDGIDGAITEMLFNACRKHTGFASDEDWSAIEDAAKNSEEAAEPPSSSD